MKLHQVFLGVQYTSDLYYDNVQMYMIVDVRFNYERFRYTEMERGFFKK